MKCLGAIVAASLFLCPLTALAQETPEEEAPQQEFLVPTPPE